MNTYQAWTRKKTESHEIYTEMKASSKKEFKKWMEQDKRIICSSIFTKKY